MLALRSSWRTGWYGFATTLKQTKSEETPGKVPKKPLHVIEYLF
jgi:hypothetical protein